MNTDTTSSPKLLDQVRERLRLKHYSIKTEHQYVQWVRRVILFHQKHHPAEMGVVEVEAFLTYLAVEEQVVAVTQNQALSALLFLYREMSGVDLPWLDNVVRAKRPARLPVVLTRREVAAALDRMQGIHGLMASAARYQDALPRSCNACPYAFPWNRGRRTLSAYAWTCWYARTLMSSDTLSATQLFKSGFQPVEESAGSMVKRSGFAC
ncbi:hypothetical protein AGMMS50256_11670 [Betaproteobacteria bacterium]|nr:hypothetical protein AGMMS50256_11670 [Betaproteobacteria bacterium]